jgi:hypothetical protein
LIIADYVPFHDPLHRLYTEKEFIEKINAQKRLDLNKISIFQKNIPDSVNQIQSTFDLILSLQESELKSMNAKIDALHTLLDERKKEFTNSVNVNVAVKTSRLKKQLEKLNFESQKCVVGNSKSKNKNSMEIKSLQSALDYQPRMENYNYESLLVPMEIKPKNVLTVVDESLKCEIQKLFKLELTPSLQNLEFSSLIYDQSLEITLKNVASFGQIEHSLHYYIMAPDTTLDILEKKSGEKKSLFSNQIIWNHETFNQIPWSLWNTYISELKSYPIGLF